MVDPRLDEIIDGVEAIKAAAEAKQEELVSGENIKTINNQSVLGSGNLEVGSGITVDTQVDDSSTNPVENRAIADYVDSEISLVQDQVTVNTQNISNLESSKQNALVSGTNIKTINEQSILGSGNLDVGSDITVDSTVDSLSDNPVENRAIYAFVTDMIDSVDDETNSINSKIPAQASADNQLADKDFVNSSISTATATFRGTFTDLSALQVTDGDLNDYAFYSHTDTAGNTIYDRYKYTGLPETRVPDGYIERLTLNKTGGGASQVYINTGVKIASTDSIYAVINVYTNNYAGSSIFGAMDNDGNFVNLSKTVGAGTNYEFRSNSGATNGRFNGPYVFEYIDGTVYKSSVFAVKLAIPSVDADLYLFGNNNNGTYVNGQDYLNIGNFVVIALDGHKKCDLVPCTRTLDNVNSFYDVVSKQFLPPIDGTLNYTPLSTDKWTFEYSLNNSSFTADQWAAINSGLVQKVTSTGYDANATQVLKNINGVIQWVTE